MNAPARQKRTFNVTSEGRGFLPVLFGIASPSGAGKTYSAIRLAMGMRRVTGGKVCMIDTESDRALAYRYEPQKNPNGFRFEHLRLSAPYSPLDYLDALEEAVEKIGAKTVIIDSFTHEHQGQGGVLEMHAARQVELARRWNRLGDDDTPEHWMLESANFSAWDEPKGQRRQLLSALTTRWPGVNFILCFRARMKSRPAKKGEKGTDGKPTKIVEQGWSIEGSVEYLFEMTARALLTPNADGVPTWTGERENERNVFKLPLQFRSIFATDPPHALCEADGEAMARWGAAPAAAAPSVDVNVMLSSLELTPDVDAWREVNAEQLKKLSKVDKQRIADAGKRRREQLAAAAAPPPPDEEPPADREPGDDSDEE